MVEGNQGQHIPQKMGPGNADQTAAGPHNGTRAPGVKQSIRDKLDEKLAWVLMVIVVSTAIFAFTVSFAFFNWLDARTDQAVTRVEEMRSSVERLEIKLETIEIKSDNLLERMEKINDKTLEIAQTTDHITELVRDAWGDVVKQTRSQESREPVILSYEAAGQIAEEVLRRQASRQASIAENDAIEATNALRTGILTHQPEGESK